VPQVGVTQFSGWLARSLARRIFCGLQLASSLASRCSCISGGAEHAPVMVAMRKKKHFSCGSVRKRGGGGGGGGGGGAYWRGGAARAGAASVELDVCALRFLLMGF
jgi:hypothetical protein